MFVVEKINRKTGKIETLVCASKRQAHLQKKYLKSQLGDKLQFFKVEVKETLNPTEPIECGWKKETPTIRRTK